MSENFKSIVRTILTAVGGLLIGKAFFGITIDVNVIEAVIGIVLSVGGIVWGFVDKSINVESLQSLLRNLAATLGGLLIGGGRNELALTITNVIGVLIAIVPLFAAFLDHAKSEKLARNEIEVRKLAGARPVYEAKQRQYK